MVELAIVKFLNKFFSFVILLDPLHLPISAILNHFFIKIKTHEGKKQEMHTETHKIEIKIYIRQTNKKKQCSNKATRNIKSTKYYQLYFASTNYSRAWNIPRSVFSILSETPLEKNNFFPLQMNIDYGYFFNQG